MFCPQCETELDSSNYCSHCQASIPQQLINGVKPRSTATRTVLIILFSLIIIPCFLHALNALIAWTKYDLWWILYGFIVLIIACGTAWIAVSKISTKYRNKFFKRSLAIVFCAVIGAIVFLCVVFIDFSHPLLDTYEGQRATVTFDGETDCFTIYSLLEENGYHVSDEINENNIFWFHYEKPEDYNLRYGKYRGDAPYRAGHVQCQNSYLEGTEIVVLYDPGTNHPRIISYLKRKETEHWINGEIVKLVELIELETELVHTGTEIIEDWDHTEHLFAP